MSSFSIRRLNKELESFIKDPSPEYTASPIKDDLYCWHFTIRGPSDTSFENGIYHGVIKLPYSYFTTLSSMDGQYLGPTPVTYPPYILDFFKLSFIIL